MITTNIRLPPLTVIGNPTFVSAPAQAITFNSLLSAVFGSLLTHQTLPANVDFNYLPPQTLVGNPTATANVKLTFITFSQFNALLGQVGLPTTIYKNFDPNSVPPYTVIGNISKTKSQFAVPIGIGNIVFPREQPQLLNLFYFQQISTYSISPKH